MTHWRHTYLGFIFRAFATLSLVSFVVVALLTLSILYSKVAASDDQKIYRNWGLNKIDLNCARAAEGEHAVVVAVVDTGLDISDDLFQGRLFEDHGWDMVGPPIYGWDFAEGHANPKDHHGHGTHVAGIIASIAEHAVIMPVRFYDDAHDGLRNTVDTAKAIRWAVDHGAKVINYSGGGSTKVKQEYDAIRYAGSKGVLVVAAAGNEHWDIEKPGNEYYPASYRLPNEIVVAATDIRDNLIATSDWGPFTVDLAAPGENILSTLPGGREGYMTGTSQATAFVTGVAAMILEAAPGLRPEQLKKILVNSVDQRNQLINRVASIGRLNACKALAGERWWNR